MYKITVGYEGATDSCLCINDKQYAVESTAWNLIYIIKNHRISGVLRKNLLAYIYKNFDEDQFYPAEPSIKDKLKKIAAKIIFGELKDINENISLYNLGFDSLDFVEFIMEVEKEYFIAIPDDIVENLTTIEKMARYVQEKI